MIGVLVGTVVVDNYLNIIQALQVVILKSGKKSYEILVGKLNEPKLKNIAIVDLYVYVGCREQSIIDKTEFLMPVVTPHEVLMAL